MAIISSKRALVMFTLLSSGRFANAFLPSAKKMVAPSSILWRRTNVQLSHQVTTKPRISALVMSRSRANKDDDNNDDDGDEESSEIKVPRKFKAFPFQYHEELTLTVDALTNRGIGVCRAEIPESAVPADDEQRKAYAEDSKGWVVMVPNSIPGEVVRVKVYRNFGTYSEADLLEIVEASPERVTPVCPLADECGGCQYQHMSIGIQRDWKSSQVQELLEKIGKLDPDTFPKANPTVGTDEVYHYRSKITPHYDRPIKVDVGDVKIRAIGFKKKTNRSLLDVTYCHIATEAINEKLTEYREEKFKDALEGRLKKSKKGATLLLRDAMTYTKGDLVTEEPVVETDPNVYVKTKVKDLTFRFLASNFFQNNPFMLPVMVDHVVEAAIQPSAAGEKMTHLIDCYCGSGLFCLSAAKDFEVCVGIEVNERAVEEAQTNASINSISNCKFVAASAEAIFMSKDPVEVVTKTASGGEILSSTLVKDFPKKTTVVVIDPPRKGCSPEFLKVSHSLNNLSSFTRLLKTNDSP
jgi:tRNA/tmRNA/rRNA uracil-C5-methylase (TrmA/RlmC/RlmD family)